MVNMSLFPIPKEGEGEKKGYLWRCHSCKMVRFQLLVSSGMNAIVKLINHDYLF